MKIRLRQEKVLKLVLDAVIDYPAPVFLQRPSLLQSIFDVLSVPFSELDYGEFSNLVHSRPYSLFLFVEADPYGYHPIFVLEIIDKLLEKSESTYRLYLDGSFCSPVSVQTNAKTEEVKINKSE